jgi:hypothetical protein
LEGDVTAHETFDHKGLTVKIIQDEHAESPDTFGDCEVFLVANHREFYVTPPEDRKRRWSGNYGIAEFIKDHEKTHHVFLLEAYIHSGVSLAITGTRNFPDRCFDVSPLGAVFVSKKEKRLRKSALKLATGLVETWNQYLSGDVWGYEITSTSGHEDSCWGFYGLEYCKKEAISAADGVADRLQKLHNETLIAEAMP